MKHTPCLPSLHWARHLGPQRPWVAVGLLRSHLCHEYVRAAIRVRQRQPEVLETSLAILSRNAFNNMYVVIKSSEGLKMQAAKKASRNDSQASTPERTHQRSF